MILNENIFSRTISVDLGLCVYRPSESAFCILFGRFGTVLVTPFGGAQSPTAFFKFVNALIDIFSLPFFK